MEETQKKRYQHLTNPWVIISLLVAIFGIGTTWWVLNYRVNKLEDFQKEVNLVEIQKTLSQIQTDLEWIKRNLSNNK